MNKNEALPTNNMDKSHRKKVEKKSALDMGCSFYTAKSTKSKYTTWLIFSYVYLSPRSISSIPKGHLCPLPVNAFPFLR